MIESEEESEHEFMESSEISGGNDDFLKELDDTQQLVPALQPTELLRRDSSMKKDLLVN